MDINELRERLNIDIPGIYLDLVKKGSVPEGFDPKTICILNLQLRTQLDHESTKDRFFLTGDGCGNFYFVEAGDDKVLLLSHDPEGIEKSGVDLAEFLREAYQENPIVEVVEEGEINISRTLVPGESILDPITLEEWKNTIEEIHRIRYLGYREGINPFTGEVIRFDKPGFAVVKFDGETINYSLYCGRLHTSYSKRNMEIAQEIAKILGANVLGGES